MFFARRDREELNCYWKHYRPYAQSGFHKTILTNEEKSFALVWEMLLASRLVTHGFTLRETRNEEPDLRLDINGQTVWIECCVPDKGDSEPEKVNGVKVHPDNYGKGFRQIDPDRVVLRWTNALSEKFKQYQKRIQAGLCTSDQPYIIAVNGYKAGLDYKKGEMPDIMRAVYGMGDQIIIYDRNSGESDSHYSSQDSIDKNSGASVSTCFFENESHKGITGIIYTQDSPFSCMKMDYCYVENVLSPRRGDFWLWVFYGNV